MKVKVLKFFIVGAFLAFAACAFFISDSGRTGAKSNEAAKKKAGILEKVADYKTWKQINKTDKEAKSEVIAVTDFSAYG